MTVDAAKQKEGAGAEMPNRKAFTSYGGLTRFKGKILPRFPKTYKRYVELFCGSGEMIWCHKATDDEVMNDLDSSLMRLHRLVKDLSDEQLEALAKRDWKGNYKRYGKMAEARTAGRVPSADADFLYSELYTRRFGRWNDKPFSWKDSMAFRASDKGKDYAPSMARRVKAARDRMQGVTLTNLDYAAAIKRFDGPDAFFFIDPPYPGADKFYRLKAPDTAKMVKAFKGIKGRAMLVLLGKREHIKPFLDMGWHITRFSWPRERHDQKAPQGGETAARAMGVLITNYKPTQKSVLPALGETWPPLCVPDPEHLLGRLDGEQVAGVLTTKDQGAAAGAPLALVNYDDRLPQSWGVVEVRKGVQFPTGAKAVEVLGDKVCGTTARVFKGIAGPVWFHPLDMLELWQAPQAINHTQKAVWTQQEINDLPDASFLLIESGGKKDDEGKTVPRTLRHFPVRDADGAVDLPHLRNAIARIPQAKIPGFSAEDKAKLQDKARRLLADAQKRTSKEAPPDLAALSDAELDALVGVAEAEYAHAQEGGDTAAAADALVAKAVVQKAQAANPKGPWKWWRWSVAEAKAWLRDNADEPKLDVDKMPNFYAFRQQEPGDAEFRTKWVGPEKPPPAGTEEPGRPVMLVLFASGPNRGQVQSYRFYHGKADVAEAKKTVDVAKGLSPQQEAEYQAESERIKENKKKPAAKQPHRFRAAKFTHPNGHPRCLVCGNEERISGWCNSPDKDRAAISKAAGGRLSKPHKCDYCRREGNSTQATKAVVWAEGRAYQAVCAAHLEKAKRELDDVVAVRDLPQPKQKAESFAPLSKVRPQQPKGEYADADAALKAFATDAALKAGVAVEPYIDGPVVVVHWQRRGDKGEARVDGAGGDEQGKAVKEAVAKLEHSAVVVGAMGEGGAVHVTDLLYWDSEALGSQPWHKRAAKRQAVLARDKGALTNVPGRVVHGADALKAAVKWATNAPGSAGAVLRLAGAAYQPGGRDNEATIKAGAVVNAIVCSRSEDGTLQCAVGPLAENEVGDWSKTVEVNGRAYAPIGSVDDRGIGAKAGDVVRVQVAGFEGIDTPGNRAITWTAPIAQERVHTKPSTTADVRVRSNTPGKRTQKGGRLHGSVELPEGLQVPPDMLVVRILKASDEQRFVLGIVLEPNDGTGTAPLKPDAHKDIYSAADIMEACHLYLIEYGGGVGLEHQQELTSEDVVVCENYIMPCDGKVGGQHVRKGTWMLGARVLNDDVWQRVKRGELNAWSIDGEAQRTPAAEG